MKDSITRIIAMTISVHTTLLSMASGIQSTDTVPDIPIEFPMDSLSMLAINTLSADINKNARPEPLYKTPEASAFQEYGKFGTEGYGGSIDISIPIHTVSCRDLHIPISLHYGGRGIKVAEEASWVGLGWDLSVGGCINCVAAGQYDHLVRDSQWNDYLEIIDIKSDDVFQKEADVIDYKVMGDLINGLGERDFYSVNIMGKSFLFFINPSDNKPTIIGADDSDYLINRKSTDGRSIIGWEIKDALGFIYEFSALEYTLSNETGLLKSAWYLSSIETPQGIIASFTYDTSYVYCIPQAYQWYHAYRSSYMDSTFIGTPTAYSFPMYGSGASFDGTEIIKPWLNSITVCNQTVTFEMSERTDFRGARKLDWIKISDINGTDVYLYHFNYSKFSSCTIGGSCPDISKHLINDPRNSERLKLLSFSQMALNKKDSITHMFTYFENNPLPLKTSAAIDLWGYYNGQENKTINSHITDSRSIIPSLLDCTMHYSTSIKPSIEAMTIKGACRYTDPEMILSGTLSSITYPTGGKSVFTFEPHLFHSLPIYPLRNTGYRDVSTDVEDISYPTNGQTGGPITNKQIDVAIKSIGYLTVVFEAKNGKKLRDLQQAKSSVTVQPMTSPSYKKIHISLDSCHNVNMESTYHKEIFQVLLEPVSYRLIANLSSSIAYGEGHIWGNLQFREFDTTLESGGAGLRIAEVDNYDDNGELLGRRLFEYTKTDGTTSGHLIVGAKLTESRIKYIEHVLSRDHYGDIESAFRASLGVIKIKSALNSGQSINQALVNTPVGYTRVSEKEQDGKGNLIRKTVKEYKSLTFTERIPEIYVQSSLGNGDITRETVYDPDDNIVRSVDYDYVQKHSSTMKCNIAIEDQYYEYGGDDIAQMARRYLLKIYPYISYWRTIAGITTREYTPQGIMESKQNFTYNDTNRLVSEECMSAGSIGTRTTYKYTVDYPLNSQYKLMTAPSCYLRGIPVETTTYELYDGKYTEVRKEKISYKFNANKPDMLHIGSIEEYVTGGPLQASESFTYSDVDGTLVGTVKNASDNRAYLWSYAHTCPVAVIDGATYSEVESWIGASFVNSLSAAKTGIESLLSQLRTKLKDKGVTLTTYTYKPLVGITSQTSPTGEKTTYEYDGFNRLARILDHNGKVVETYSYTYK